MVAKILIKRRVPHHLQQRLLPVLLEMRKQATVQPGYISGETLQSYENPEEYLVISTWRSVDNWEKWRASLERKELQGKIDEMLPEPTGYTVYLLGGTT